MHFSLFTTTLLATAIGLTISSPTPSDSSTSTTIEAAIAGVEAPSDDELAEISSITSINLARSLQPRQFQCSTNFIGQGQCQLISVNYQNQAGNVQLHIYDSYCNWLVGDDNSK
jgi:hypothetical protein